MLFCFEGVIDGVYLLFCIMIEGVKLGCCRGCIYEVEFGCIMFIVCICVLFF